MWVIEISRANVEITTIAFGAKIYSDIVRGYLPSQRSEPFSESKV